MRISILGVPVDNVTRLQTLEKIKMAVEKHEQPYFVITPNPEFVVLAQRDPEFKTVLQAADLSISDGIGLLWAAKQQGQELLERVTGADLVLDICAWAARSSKRVYLLGGDPGVAKKAAKALMTKFPGLEIVGAKSGGEMYKNQESQWRIYNVVWEDIQQEEPDILFVASAFGKQEKWIHQNIGNMPWLKLGMGIGGTFDFLSGNAKRAPKWMRLRGLEWLWRLWKEPHRIRRIIRAIIVFPYLILRQKYWYNK